MIEIMELNDHRVYYTLYSDDIIQSRIEVYDIYTNGLMFYNKMDLHPNASYFTYIPFTWSNMRICIYNDITNELLIDKKLNGDRKINQYDEYGYLCRLINSTDNITLQSSLHNVIGEHFYNTNYKYFIDIDENDIVFDVGFNYGIFSLYALYNNAKKIYGFEPNIDIYNKIYNIFPELDKVELYNYAVSDSNKFVKFNSTEDSLRSSITIDYNDSVSYDVKCINLYDFIIENNIEQIDFLKIDCEGEEYNIFNSIPDDYFCKIKKIMVEFHFNDGNKINILTDKLNRTGFNWIFEKNSDDMNNELGLIFAKNK
jgi:FkbM family methyltransferase